MEKRPYRTVTLLDLKLGHVQLTEEEQRQIRERVVPILARVAQRILREQEGQNQAGETTKKRKGRPRR